MKNSYRFSKRKQVASLLATLLCWGLFLPAQAPRVARAQEKASTGQNLPPNPVEQAERDRTALRLSLRDLTKLALQNNLDIAISDTNEELYQQRLIQTYGPYDPALVIGLGVQSNKSPNTNLTNQSTQGNFNKTDYANRNFQFSQNIPTGGGIVAKYNSYRFDTNQQFALFTPQYSSSLSIQFTQPLRNRTVDSQLGQLKVQRQQLLMNRRSMEQKISVQIRNAIEDLMANKQRVETAKVALRLANEQLVGETKRFQAGMSQNFLVLQRQQQLSAAKGTELQALIAYKKSIIALQQTMYTLLESNDFEVAKSDSPAIRTQ